MKYNNYINDLLSKINKEKVDESTGLDNIAQGYIEMMKKGGIHIKKENRGKFTKSAHAAGEGVQEHAHKVMNNPNATPLQRKRANFAIQSKKWHHK